MEAIRYGTLSYMQLGLVAQLLESLFPTKSELNYFLITSGLRPAADFGEELTLPMLSAAVAQYLDARGLLEEVIDKLQHDTPRAPLLRSLPDRLLRLQPSSFRPPASAATGEPTPFEVLLENSEIRSASELLGKFDRLCAAMCMIRVSAGRRMKGTGFLVAGDLVLTAYHVVEDVFLERASTDDIRITFGLIESVTDGSRQTDTVSVADIPAHQRYSDTDLTRDGGDPRAGELDFALLRVSKALSSRERVELPTVRKTGEGAIATVLQHPRGQALSYAVGNILPTERKHRTQYDVSTEPGSSGGLVVTDLDMYPLAMHHAGEPKGHLPARYNQGIPLVEVRQAIRTHL